MFRWISQTEKIKKYKSFFLPESWTVTTGTRVNCEYRGKTHFFYTTCLLCVTEEEAALTGKLRKRGVIWTWWPFPFWATEASLREAVQHVLALVWHHPSHALLLPLLHHISASTAGETPPVLLLLQTMKWQRKQDTAWTQGTVPKICKYVLFFLKPTVY